MAAPTTPVLYGLALGGTAWKPMVPASFANVLYVDNVYGNDTTAQRGCAALPFATIQAALNAMTTDDVVLLAPQIFTLTAPLTIPASVVKGAAYGAVPGSSNRTGASQGHAAGQTTLVLANGAIASYWNIGANLGLTKWTIGDLYMGFTSSVFNSPTVADIMGDGSAYAAGTYLSVGGLLLDHCVCFDGSPVSVSLKYARYFEATGASILQNLALTTCGTSILSDGTVLQSTATAAVVTGDFADPLQPNNGAFLIMYRSNILGILVLTGQSTLFGDFSSLVGGFKGSGLSVNGTHVPSVTFNGNVGGIPGSIIDFASAGAELPDTATALKFDLSAARLYALGQSASTSGPAVVKFKVGGAAGNFQTVKLDSSAALPGTTFTADAKIHLTMRGAVAPQAVYTTPNITDGDIIPPLLSGVVDLSAGGSVAKTWSDLGYGSLVRTGVAPDVGLATPNAQLSDVAITAKNTTGMTFASNNIVGDNAVDWQSLWK